MARIWRKHFPALDKPNSEESGDPEVVAKFDLESWVRGWMDESTPALGGRTPAEMLRNPEGQRAVEELLERMRGGLPA